MQSGVTIELGVMYIPSESLMQLIDLDGQPVREEIFRDHRVLIMGPNSLAAYLISVHMGFRTLAFKMKEPVKSCKNLASSNKRSF
jgi:DNA anti-recombination protein RmuC